MSLFIKICGLTRNEDVRAAVEAGANALGFILYPGSKRYVSLERLADLTACIPDTIRRVGVAVNATEAELAAAVRAGGLDIIQFHGEETDAQILAWTRTTAWRVCGLRNEDDIERAARLRVDTVLVDAVLAGARGGTGKRCDWNLAAKLAQRRRIILAGGLTPENVAEALQTVTPWGIDVSSGIEQAPGVKNQDRMRQFIRRARNAAPRRHATDKPSLEPDTSE